MKTLANCQDLSRDLKINEEVDETIVDHFVNSMLPVTMTGACIQMGGSVDHVERDGKLYPTYLTLKRSTTDALLGKPWKYAGELPRL